MESNKQVNKEHYGFGGYVTKPRWASMWHQLDEVLALQPENVLEIGPGPGLFKAAGMALGLNIETLDIDPELAPDHVGSCMAMPFSDGAFDVVCAFQMLEHLPYKDSLATATEMARVARKAVVISLPDAKHAWPYSFYIPKAGDVKFYVWRPAKGRKAHQFDGQHYWEMNKKGYSVRKVVSDMADSCKGSLKRTYRVKEMPYHRFVVIDLVSP